jgi:hypothetical protein
VKGITLTQPWATCVAIGAKTIETRSWTTQYRGWLAVRAAKGLADPVFDEKGLLEWCRREPFRTALTAAGYRAPAQLPLGAIVAVVELVDVVPTESLICEAVVRERGERELGFGNFGPGRFAWLLRGIRKLDEPLEQSRKDGTAPGTFQGLWECPPALTEKLLPVVHGPLRSRPPRGVL